MLGGEPIVASNVDAIPSIITNSKNGLLVTEDNTEEACDATVQLYEDCELRSKLIKCESIIVHEKYDAKRVSQEHEEVFENI